MKNTRWLMFIALFAGVLQSSRVEAQPPQVPFLRIETGQHIGAVNRILILPDRERVLTVSDDQTARVWRIEDGRLLSVLRGPAGPGDEGALFAAAANERYIALAGRAGWDWGQHRTAVRILDSETLAPRGTLSGLTAPIGALDFSPDGRYLAVGLIGPQAGLRIYRLGQGKPVLLDRDFTDGLTDLAYSADGRLLAIDGSGMLKVYPTEPQLSNAHQLRLDRGLRPWRLAVSPDGSHVAIGLRDTPYIVTLSLRTGKATKLYLRSKAAGALPIVAWSPLHGQLYGAGRTAKPSHQEMLYAWRAADGELTEITSVGFATITALATDIEGGVLFGTSSGNWGRLTAQGQLDYLIENGKPHLEAAHRSPLLLSFNASIVEFPLDPLGKRRARFNLNKRRLVFAESTASALSQRVKVPIAPDLDDDSMINGIRLQLAANERMLDAAKSASNTDLALGTNFYVRLYNDGQLVWKVAVPAPAWGIALSEDNNYLVAALGNGMIQWLRRSDGALVLSMFATSDLSRWVVWTPRGYFEHSSARKSALSGASLVGFHINKGDRNSAEFIKIDQLYRQYYRGDLVMAAFRGVTLELPSVESGSKIPDASDILMRSPPPKLRVGEACIVDELGIATHCRAGNEGKGTDVSSGSYSVELPYGPWPAVEFILEAEDTGGGIGRFEIRRNGARIQAREIDTIVRPGQLAKRLHVPLLPGENNIVIRAFDTTEKVASQTAAVNVPTPVQSAQNRRVIVVAVGISDYKFDGFDLQEGIAANDARAIAERFQGAAGSTRLYQSVETQVLINSEATKAAIIAALKQAAYKAGPEDAVIIFFSGHGEVVDGNYHYATYEMGEGSRDVIAQLLRGERFEGNTIRDIYRREGLNQDQLIDAVSQIQARRVVILLDTCYAGSFSVLGLEQRRDLSFASMNRVVRESGRFVVASARGLAHDSDGKDYPVGFGNGLFTSNALDALDGKADIDRDHNITLAEFGSYVKRSVVEASHGWEIPQEPVIGFQGDPFFPLLDIVEPTQQPSQHGEE